MVWPYGDFANAITLAGATRKTCARLPFGVEHRVAVVEIPFVALLFAVSLGEPAERLAAGHAGSPIDHHVEPAFPRVDIDGNDDDCVLRAIAGLLFVGPGSEHETDAPLWRVIAG